MTRQQITVITIDRDANKYSDMDDLGTITSDGKYYYLPGADQQQTAAALRSAGFQTTDTIDDAFTAQYPDA